VSRDTDLPTIIETFQTRSRHPNTKHVTRRRWGQLALTVSLEILGSANGKKKDERHTVLGEPEGECAPEFVDEPEGLREVPLGLVVIASQKISVRVSTRQYYHGMGKIKILAWRISWD
jgi:hypothetical protein